MSRQIFNDGRYGTWDDGILAKDVPLGSLLKAVADTLDDSAVLRLLAYGIHGFIEEDGTYIGTPPDSWQLLINGVVQFESFLAETIPAGSILFPWTIDFPGEYLYLDPTIAPAGLVLFPDGTYSYRGHGGVLHYNLYVGAVLYAIDETFDLEANMTIAQGIKKAIAVKKQTGLGVPATGSGGQVLRRETSQIMLGKDTYANNEIVQHQQDTGVTHGLRKPTAKLSGVLSPGTYSSQIASLVRAAFASISAATGVGVTIAGAGPYTVTRGTGSYLTDGFKIGDVIRLTVGTLNAANINKNLLIINLTATIATVVVLNGSAMVAEGPISGTTITVQGKKTKAPTTGHTNEYWTIEEWQSDIAKSEQVTDAQVSKIDIGLPGTGNSTIAIDWVALDRQLNGTQQLTTPTAETTTPVLTAVNGVIIFQGAAVGLVTGLSLSIDGTVAPLGAVVGSDYSPDTQRGRIKVSGSLTAYYQDANFSQLFDDGTVLSATIVLAADTTATSKFVGFTLPAFKFTGDSPDDGEKGIVRTFNFVAEFNGSGGAALANDQTIISIQDSDAA
jgi:hypothetical protein